MARRRHDTRATSLGRAAAIGDGDDWIDNNGEDARLSPCSLSLLDVAGMVGDDIDADAGTVVAAPRKLAPPRPQRFIARRRLTDSSVEYVLPRNVND